MSLSHNYYCPFLTEHDYSMGWDWNLILMSYGKIFNAYRRVVQQEFQANVVPQYRPVIEQEVISLLGRLLEIPDALVKHLKRCVSFWVTLAPYTMLTMLQNDSRNYHDGDLRAPSNIGG